MSNVWIFSNNRIGYYEDSDWDTSTILKTKHYYFKESEPNRYKIKKGDIVLFREYGFGFWGSCEISDDWVHDDKGKERYEIDTGWFPIDNIVKWKVALPYEIIRSELSNQNFRLRIAKANLEDKTMVNKLLASI